MHAAPTFGNPIGNLASNYKHRVGIVTIGIGKVAAGTVLGPTIGAYSMVWSLLSRQREESISKVVLDSVGLACHVTYKLANEGVQQIDAGLRLIRDPRSEAKDYL